ncbi:MAG: hypothetical protein LC687_00085 [Actinobacteria bacterium]|nr:hypothetical protein [Actinomycetota bacterium]
MDELEHGEWIKDEQRYADGCKSDDPSHTKRIFIPTPMLADQISPSTVLLAEGVWCLACGFFEEAHEMTERGCQSCGCPVDRHSPAKVIVA